MMSVRSRQDYAREVSARYVSAGRKEKGRILDEFCRTTGYNRKYAVSLLRHPPPVREEAIRRPRATKYTPAVKRELMTLWKATTVFAASGWRLLSALSCKPWSDQARSTSPVRQRYARGCLRSAPPRSTVSSAARSDRGSKGMPSPNQAPFSGSRSRYAPSPTGKRASGFLASAK
jgi:hypothetical protein